MELFEDICKRYYDQDLGSFQPFLNPEILDRLNENDYLRIPIYQGECQVILMVWGIGAKTAIHDHGGSRGRVKVMKGCVTEKRYRFQNRKLEILSSEDHKPGEILDVAPDTIHAVSNKASEVSMTLHIYDIPSGSFEGTILYDKENQKIGILNNLATKASWKEKPEAFSRITDFADMK